MKRIYIMLQKLSVESKKIINKTDGGALSILMLGLVGFLVMLIVLLFFIDLSIYSYKKKGISAAIDYAVSAAVQEIDADRSRVGLAKAFTADGQVSLKGVYLDESKADKAFTSTISENVKVDIDNLNKNMVRFIETPTDTGFYYSVKDANGQSIGSLDDITKIQDILNTRMTNIAGMLDAHTIYVNGNAKTNSFEQRPYYMVFIRDYEIDGIFTKRKATFVSFKGAKIYR